MVKSVILEAIGLSIGYSNKVNPTIICKDITLQLERGKLITLVGANGIGKSTLLRTLTGIQKPLHGKVTLHGKEIQQYKANTLAQEMSLVLTEKLQTENISVYELIALGRQPYTNWLGKLTSQDEIKIKEAIEQTQIAHLCDKKVIEVSDGQLQKALIARALAQDTSIIVLDEPTTHLDLFHKVAVFKLLKKLSNETGKCIVLSTHDIDMAIQISDEMIVITEQNVVQDQPCNLISKGIFDTIFKDTSIKFDSEKGKFVISN
jgi:iron complex transport system ATP-binding protein